MPLDEIKKSFNSVFKERVTSPLYGAFLVSWVIWNWKILYLTIFISREEIKSLTKIEYILNNYVNWFNLLLFPSISTAFLIILIPWVGNQAYFKSLKFKESRIKAREEFESKRRLTTDQSNILKEKIIRQEENHQKMIDSKDVEIQLLNKELKKLIDLHDSLKTNLKIYEKDVEMRNKEMEKFIQMEIKGKKIDDSKILEELATTIMNKFYVSNDTAKEIIEDVDAKYGTSSYLHTRDLV